MQAQLDILTGSLAGQRVAVSQSALSLGRDQTVDLQFDPQGDRAVSGRHASIFWERRQWKIRDLGSLNGTFLNGRRIVDPTPLQDGDRIQLGAEGPTLEFRSLGRRSDAVDGKGASRGSPLKWAVPILLVALVGVGAGVIIWREGQRHADEVRAMQARIDSILDSSAAMADELLGRNQALDEALRQSQDRLRTVRRELEAAQAEGDPDQIEALRVQLQEAQAALARHQMAAAIDTDAIESANGMAVAKVFVDFGGEVVTATAFAVRPDGTLLTNRHVVAGVSGRERPQRLAVQFAGSRQVWPARIAALSQAEDLAALKVDNIRGTVPTISGFNERPDTIPSGQAVVVIGFPLGGATPSGEGAGSVARSTVTIGIIEAVSRERLDVRGYGVEGSSGSPVFDGDGKVIGVLFGADVQGGERTLYNVPASLVTAFLDRVY